ncbi:putative ABC transporter permease [Slackia heliotrinireducens]|uniref:putative ABC transporter permease n=1 Tax=Slackia heliotrinireducens TaxID=84110 RepID=UPI003316135E
MAEPNGTLDIIENVRDEEPEKLSLFVRIYGALSIIAGGLQVLSFVLAILTLVGFFGRVDLSELEYQTTTALVITLVSTVLSVAAAVLFVVLGVRLIRGNRRRAALIANVLITIEALIMVCNYMMTGMSSQMIAPGINMVILIAIQSYCDPALLEERRLQRKLLALNRKAEAEDGTLGRDTTGRGYITLNFFNIFWVFVVCCFLGLVVEVIYHMTVVDFGVYQDRAGLLYGPFSPIYGVGAVLMTVALNRFYNRNPFIIFVVSGIIGGAFEFFVSWFMQVSFGIVAWDYSGTFLNIDGRTNFMFMCMWGALGLAWVRFALPIMLKIVNKIPWNWRYSVTMVCTVLMTIDCVLTLASFDSWYQREAGTMDYEDTPAIVEFCNEHYDNDFMTSRFQTMIMNPDNASRAR